MRLYPTLFAQHLGWTFKKHWQVQGKRIPRDTGALSELLKYGITVKDPNKAPEFQEHFGTIPEVNFSVSQPVCEESSLLCHVFNNSSVPLEGLLQAQNVSNAVLGTKFQENINEKANNLNFSTQVERKYKNLILSSFLLDAVQEKTPRVRLENRPYFNLPRTYGIPPERSTRHLIKNMLNECDKNIECSKRPIKKVFEDCHLNTIVRRNEDLLHFNISFDFMIFSTQPLESQKENITDSVPEMYPLKYTVGMRKGHLPNSQSKSSSVPSTKLYHPHTIISVFNKNSVSNLHQSDVTDMQLQGRSVLLAYAAAVNEAKKLYGESFKQNLPKPIFIQSILTNGSKFYFGAFQLNTLCESDEGGSQNYCYKLPASELFTFCGNRAGRPYVDNLNMNVIKTFNAFCNNI